MKMKALVDHLYHKKMPALYRIEDKKVDFHLYKFLSAVFMGGESVINRINDFSKVLDPLKCPDKFIPSLTKTFGIKFYEDIPLKYYRRLLSEIGELNRRRGSYSSIEYLAKVLTGFDVDLNYQKINNKRTLTVEIFVNSVQDLDNIDIDIKVLKDFLKDFLPFNLNLVLNANMRSQIISLDLYRFGVTTQHLNHKLVGE